MDSAAAGNRLAGDKSQREPAEHGDDLRPLLERDRFGPHGKGEVIDALAIALPQK